MGRARRGGGGPEKRRLEWTEPRVFVSPGLRTFPEGWRYPDSEFPGPKTLGVEDTKSLLWTRNGHVSHRVENPEPETDSRTGSFDEPLGPDPTTESMDREWVSLTRRDVDGPTEPTRGLRTSSRTDGRT